MASVWINEFHYDNAGTDAGEFVEIAGVAGTDLAGWLIVLYNGNGGAPYDTRNLAGIIANQSNGFGTLSVTYPSNGIQNGSPDGIALVDNLGNVIEFISYEGSITAVGGPADGLTSTDVGVSETGSANGTSIARTGTGSDSTDFAFVLDTDDTPGVVNNGQTFSGAPTGDTIVSFGDASVVEGNAGQTLLTFTVTRSDETRAFNVDFATEAGSAGEGTDYDATFGTISFGVGDGLTRTFTVGINGDSDVEPNETFGVRLSSLATGVVLANANATGTIINDDAAPVDLTPIYEIQGAGHKSPFVGGAVGVSGNSGALRVTTEGVVTAIGFNGFYIQDALGDGNDATSDGIFVFTGTGNVPASLALGESVQVNGRVDEFRPGGSNGGNNLTITQLNTTVSGSAILDLGGLTDIDEVIIGVERSPSTSIIDNDSFATFDPNEDAIDFWESLEGMAVTIPASIAVSPTAQFPSSSTPGLINEEIWVSIPSLTDETSRNDRGGLTLEEDDVNPERVQIDDLDGFFDLVDVNVGDGVGEINGVVNYDFANYEVLVSTNPTRTDNALLEETTALQADADTFTFASYNVENLDALDPQERFDDIAAQIVGNLKSPLVIGVQEMQDNDGATNSTETSAALTAEKLINAIIAAGGPSYTYVDIPPVDDTSGGEPGGNIRVGFLYQADAVTLVPGSLTEIKDPADVTDSGTDDGAFLSSRKPLVADFEFNGETFTVINNHFNSKGGDGGLYGNQQPPVLASEVQRLQQATLVNAFVDDTIAGGQPNIIVMGDLNDFSWSAPLEILRGDADPAGPVLFDLADILIEDPLERYSFNFQGNSQELDHVLVSQAILDDFAPQFDLVHVNSEFADQVSDHDPSVTALTVSGNFTLQLLHFSDGEAGLLASTTAPLLAALVDGFDDDYANTLILAGGDNYIPGPFLAAGTDPSVAAVTGRGNNFGAADIQIHNLIGVEASTIGNHEFDLGTNAFNDAVLDAAFPYLSANLDFSGDSAIAARYLETVGVGGLEEASTLAQRIVPSAVVTKGGETIGLVGATTQILESISSTGNVEVEGFLGDGNETNDMVLLAAQLQPVIDDLIAQGVNKIILMAHLQQIAFEKALAPLLRGVDIILSAGSNTRLGDADDVPVEFPGHAADFADTYPIVTAGADGAPTLIVNTDNEFTYLGRLVVEFDGNGEIVTDALDDVLAINGAYAATTENLAEAWGDFDGDLTDTAFAEGTKGESVEDITEAVQAVITAKDGQIFGFTDVYLEGERNLVRNQETNLGNLTADANLDALTDALGAAAETTFVASLKNGGGIRAQIGAIDVVTGEKEPPLANPGAGKPENAISALDIENSLRFNNALMAVDLTAADLKAILEHGVGVLGNQGRFPQIGGVRFSYEPDAPAGARVQDVALIDENDRIVAKIVDDGVVLATAPSVITLVTLNFLANGGDGYPFKVLGENFRFLLNDGTLSAPVDPSLNFTSSSVVPANVLGEQRALQDYLLERYPTPETAYDIADVDQTGDTRIQNTDVRTDTVLTDGVVIEGTDGNEFLAGGSANEFIDGLAGNDALRGNAGDDTIAGGDGNDSLVGDAGEDELFGDAGDDRFDGGLGNDLFFGGTGNDFILAGDGQDTVFGGDGNEFANGQNGDDSLNGEAGNDSLRGGEGNDSLFGGADNDALVGDAGNDSLAGGDGADRLDGGAGEDTLVGGAGNDYLVGGDGADVFLFNTLGDGVDSIADFAAGIDTIALSAMGFGLGPLTLGANLVIGAGAVAASGEATVLYDTASGRLSIDADGSGAGATQTLAQLFFNPVLAADDFLLV